MSLQQKKKKAKKMRTHKVKARLGPAKKVAKLEPEELAQIVAAEGLLDDMRSKHALMSRGFQALWMQLRQKYTIVGNVDLDRKTGEIVQRETTQPSKGDLN